MTRLEFNNHILQLSRKLYIVAYRFLKNQEEAEDAVQEVFIRLWNRRDRLEEYKSVEALAVTTTKNYCIDQIRKIRTIPFDSVPANSAVIDSRESPDNVLERSEAAKILNGIIDNLPDNYREIIRKKEIDGLSYDEIAQATDQNINTLRVNLSRARNMIRDEFKRIKYEYSGNSSNSRKVL
jgi:RNA polymerase sigma factor (sigma-70 family)